MNRQQQLQNKQQTSQHSDTDTFPLQMQGSEQSDLFRKPQSNKPRIKNSAHGNMPQQMQQSSGNFGMPAGAMKKEGLLRRESPRNRRQLMNNLAMWSQNQSSNQAMAVNG